MFAVEWYVEPHVLQLRYSEDVTLEEIEQAHLRIQHLTAYLSHRVYLIVDMNAVRHFPFNVRALGQIYKQERLKQIGTRLVIGQSGALRILVTHLSRVVNIECHFFETYEDAASWLCQSDEKIAQKLEICR